MLYSLNLRLSCLSNNRRSISYNSAAMFKSITINFIQSSCTVYIYCENERCKWFSAVDYCENALTFTRFVATQSLRLNQFSNVISMPNGVHYAGSSVFYRPFYAHSIGISQNATIFNQLKIQRLKLMPSDSRVRVNCSIIQMLDCKVLWFVCYSLDVCR